MKPIIEALKKLHFLIFLSLSLDWEFLFCHYPPRVLERLNFIVHKYYLLVKHLLLNRPIEPLKTFVNISGRLIYFESKFGISIFQAMIVNFEKNYIYHLKGLKKPVVLDVGAHLGFFSLTIAGLFKNPKIYVVEPLNLTFQMTSKNLAGMKDVYLKNVGFWNRDGKVPLYFDSNNLMYSSAFEERFREISPKVESVYMERLDKFISKNKIKHIDVLKLDAEGAEEKILEGAKLGLAMTHYLILECSLDFVGGTSFASVARLLKGPGYNFQLVTVGTMQRDNEGKIKVIDLLLENLYSK